MAQAGRLRKNRTWCELSVVVCDDAEITAVNRRHLDRDEATDVISFALPPFPGGDGGYTGEIIANVQRAAEACTGAGWSPSRELALYIAHGCDHLMDQDDSTRTGRNRMRRRELRWLKDAESEGLTEGLIE